MRSVGQSGRDLTLKKNNSMIDETRQHDVSILSYDEDQDDGIDFDEEEKQD